MHVKACLATILLSSALSVSAAPSGVHSGDSLSKRGDDPSVNQPITDTEWANLEAGGLSKRSTDALVKRDHFMNCGHLVTGKGGSDGHGKWVPVGQFGDLVKQFCNAYVATDLTKNHETSDTYPCVFSNGKPGYVAFAIYHTDGNNVWPWDVNKCISGMTAPLGGHIGTKRDAGDALTKRDTCYGTKNNDYEGGYWFIDGIGAIGSEMYPQSK